MQWRRPVGPVVEGTAVRSTRRVGHVLLLVAAAIAVGCSGGGEAETLRRIRAGLQSADQKASAEAVVQLKSLLQKHPAQAEARLILADHLFANADPASAKAEYQRALEGGAAAELVLPKLARAMLLTGQGAMLQGQFGNEKLKDNQAQAALKSVLAHALLKQGNAQDAKAAVDEALTAAPEHPAALLMQARLTAVQGDVPQAVALVDALIAKNPRDADALALRGELFMQQPDGKDEALRSFQRAVEADPKLVYALANLITLQIAKGDLEGAKKSQLRLRQIASNLLVTGQQEATLAYALGDHARAREVFQSLLRVAPDNVGLLLLAGQNELRLSSAVQAEAMFSKALALQPRNDTARRLLAHAQLALGQVQKSLNTIAPLVDKPDAAADLLTLAAEAHLLDGNVKAADALYARAAKLKPTDPQLRTTLATAALGRESDEWVFNELQSISARDSGISADMALVSAYLSRGKTDDALKALDGIERKRPKDANHHILKGQILAGRNDLPAARRAFDAALAISPDNLKSVLALSALDLRENKGADAKARIQTLLKQQPRSTKLMLALAELMARNPAEDPERLKLLERAVQSDGADTDARSALVAFHLGAGNTEAAVVAAQAAVAAMPQSLDMLELLARCQLRRGEFSQALNTYGKITSNSPRSSRGYLGASDIQMRGNDLDNARRTIERGLQAAPGDADLQYQSFKLALLKKQPDEARKIALQLQKDRPGNVLGWVLEGELEAAQQHWGPAATAYRKALDKSPPPSLVTKYLHVLKLGGRAAEASAFAAARLKSNPNDLVLMFYLGDLAQQGGDLKQARQYYEEVLRRNSEHLLALNNLATVHLAQKQPGALALARRAALLAPREPAVLDTLAQAQAAEGSLADAVATQRQAVTLAPDNPDLRLSLAGLLLRNGDKAEARQQLPRLAKLGAGFARQGELNEVLKELGASSR